MIFPESQRHFKLLMVVSELGKKWIFFTIISEVSLEMARFMCILPTVNNCVIFWLLRPPKSDYAGQPTL